MTFHPHVIEENKIVIPKTYKAWRICYNKSSGHKESDKYISKLENVILAHFQALFCRLNC